MSTDNIKIISKNKKARYDYFIEETFEAGIELRGTEVKSLRMGKCSIKESFVRVINNEVFIMNMNISPYEKGNIFNKDPIRVRKLLLHRSEINKLMGKVAQQGYTIVPLSIYFKGSLVKVEIALAKGKKLHDKRQEIAKRTKEELQKETLKLRIYIKDLQLWQLSDKIDLVTFIKGVWIGGSYVFDWRDYRNCS